MVAMLRSMFVPTGRRNRKRYWAVFGWLFLVGIPLILVQEAAGKSPLLLLTLPPSLILTFVTFVNYIKRLHDIGRSGWWVLAAFGGYLAVCVLAAALQAISAVLATIVALVAVTALFGLPIALGSIAGDPAANRFGPPRSDPKQLSATVFG